MLISAKNTGSAARLVIKWKNRFLSEGGTIRVGSARRPHSNPAQLGEDVVCKIIQLHECHPSWGPKKIQEVYLRAEGSAPSLSSFQRIFDKSGWVKKRKKRQHHQSGRLFDGRKATQPNEVWTVDFKGYWFSQDGRRCEPLTVRDEYSRYILQIKAMDSAKTEAVQSVFQQLFQRHGLPRAIRSDNGTPFASVQALLGLSRLSVWWLALGIDLERGRPGKPQDNGAHERMHRDIREQLQSCAQHDIATQQAAFDVWRRTFNYERPHEALRMKTPAELYERSQTTFDPNVTDITYKGMISRKIQVTGKISLDSRQPPFPLPEAGP